MAPKKISDTLPPLPPSLKSISSYIQRAEELREKDPVIAYWCTYYAAQQGLDLKSHEAGARDYLFALITLLEEMKKGLEGNDAVEHEAAGAAYVENFALKVFALADGEDRRGEVSRSTAKKFLAAANFLELLKVFEKSNNAEVNEEKVRYAKWKASEIAKAFREGRQPARGAARESEATIASADRSPGGPSTILPPEAISPNIPYQTPPAVLDQLPGSAVVPPNEVPGSGTWSTVATPGSEAFGPVPSASTRLAFTSAINRWNAAAEPNVSHSTTSPQNQTDQGRTSTISDSTKKVHFSPSVVGGLSSTDGSPPPSPNVSHRGPIGSTSPYSNYAPAAQAQSITPSSSSFGRPDPTMAPLPDSSPSGSSHTSPDGSPRQGFKKPYGRPRSGSSPSTDFTPKPGSSPPGAVGASRSSPPRSRRNSLQPSAPPPPPVPPVSSGSQQRRSSVSIRNSPSAPINPPLYPAYPPPQVPPPNSSSFTTTSTLASPSLGRTNGSPNLPAMAGLPTVSVNNPVSSPYIGNYAPEPPSPPTRYAPAPPPPPPFELTPALIQKTQKHCRFAISALEYEDVEQARKELRTALALLGG